MPVLTLPPQSPSSFPSVRAKALVFEDPESRAVLARIEQVAPSDATVLLTGETGTGKEIVARHIHQLSRRHGGPFAAVNCGAFSENLVESELFGHEKGAFTGALQAKAGWFETAHGGTLFLDEIGDLPLSVQVKLLRVLQEGEVVRLGSRRPIPTDVRLIAATNVDLQEAMLAGHFREDLFYRLNVVSVRLLPLRERPGDIAPLARFFLESYQRRLGMGPVVLSDEAVERLLTHTWPGNIRELENAIHHALLVCRDGVVVPEDLRVSAQPILLKARPPTLPPAPPSAPELTESARIAALERSLSDLFELQLSNLHERVEETLMRTAYRYCENNQLQTARLLGISRNIVRARLIQFGELTTRPRDESPPTPATGSAGVSQLPPSSNAAIANGSFEETPAAESSVRPATFSSKSRLVVGYQRFGLLFLVKALGDLDRTLARLGTRVDWVEFPAGLQLVDALHAGELDLGVVGECPPVFAQAAAAPIVYLAAEPAAPEAEAILVPRDSPVNSVRDLRGKTVALNRGANVHYLLIRALEEAGLSYADVRVTFLPPTDAGRAFASGDVDAWAIWDPLLSSVRRTMGARVLRDGRGLAQNNAYYVARRELTEHSPSVIETVLQKVEEAAHYA
ncbi:MAG TPA: aliphatic sulfonate ABC transporter substrate-binding protein, partial [Polyangiaceae bacterium]|nr:aliphatic sulfonate ABC transporter substrate-binding protein [Polyangiaceae bacterium]